MTQSTPAAFVLVKFTDSAQEPITAAEARQLFTAAGRGTLNVVDWFDDNTHGSIDMSGNEVFGWLNLDISSSEYQSRRTSGAYSRLEILSIGRAAAVRAGIDICKFDVVVVVTNIEVDLFGALGGICCTAATANKQFWEHQVWPAVLCQEIVHGLGVYSHARRHGSDQDYEDPYDVMSMFRAFTGHHPANFNRPIGPGLNAAFMQRCGWLDNTRGATTGTVTLRPLHRRDLPGPLFAKVGDYYVEYRPSRKWDTGFQSRIHIHYIANQTSYLVQVLSAGENFSWGNPMNIFEERGSISVDSIDDQNLSATITTTYAPAALLPMAGTATSIMEGHHVDGSGLVIVGGKIVRIPPRSPLVAVLENIADLANVIGLTTSAVASTAIQVDLLRRLSQQVDAQIHSVTGPSSPLDHLSREDLMRFHIHPSTSCVDFSGYSDNIKFGKQFSLNGYQFTGLKTEPFVNVSGNVVGLQFTDAGLEIDLPGSASAVTLDVASFTSKPLALHAFDSSGAVVAKDQIPGDNTVHTLTLSGNNIVKVTITGGGKKGVLVKICS